MDFIRAEIESKKRSLASLVNQSNITTTATTLEPPSKYIKRSDIERYRIEEQRLEEERELKVKEEEKQRKKQKQNVKGKGVATIEGGDVTTTTTITQDGSNMVLESFNVTSEEAVRRLRAKGQPVRLFAESDKDRRLRLRALELIEERTEGRQNDFARAMDGMEMGLELHKLEMEAKGRGDKTESEKTKEKKKLEDEDAAAAERDGDEDGNNDGKDKERRPKDEEVIVDLLLVKSNPHKVYPQIYFALKRVLKEWEQSMLDRPDNVRRSTQGKIAAATQQTSADYLKPLFKSLRKRDLAPDVLLAIAEITYNMQIREYLRANDAYLRLSIGNAPWPIGVTMVGIHERAGREKIFSNNVGHVLNDETSRKYIQSLKRLLTFSQTVRPPGDLSQMMG